MIYLSIYDESTCNILTKVAKNLCRGDMPPSLDLDARTSFGNPTITIIILQKYLKEISKVI